MKEINNIYKSEKYFDIVYQYEREYVISVSDKNIFFYHTKLELFEKLKSFSIFFYNPCINLLYHYPHLTKKQSLSIKKMYTKTLINENKSPHFWLIKTNNFEEAFLKGGGIVAVNDTDFIYHSIRLFSLDQLCIGAIPPLRFNLFFNKCPYCEGYETITSYKNDILLLDSNIAPLDKAYLFNKYLVVPKSVMKAFTEEKLFDFNKKIHKFTEDELYLYLYGIKGIGTAIAKSRPNERHYWEGLNHYLYDNRNKIKKRNKSINLEDFEEIKCPFCYYGYKNEIQRYKLNNLDIVQKLLIK